MSVAVTGGGTDTEQIFVWCAILALSVCVLAAGIWWVRRRLFADRAPNGQDVWSLQHLRELKARGQITEEEFERLKARVIDRFGDSGRSNV